MYTVVTYSYVQTDINDQIKTVVQCWVSVSKWIKRTSKAGRKTNSLHLKSSDLTLIVSHQHLDSCACSGLFRRLCRAQELTHRRTQKLLYRFLHRRCVSFISFPNLTQTNRPPRLSAPTWSWTFVPAHRPDGSNRLYGCLHDNRSVNSDSCCMF